MNKKVIKKMLIIMAVWLMIRPGFSQNALTLEDCLQLAFQNSRMLQVADISMDIAVQQISESKAQQLPAISLSGIYTRIGKITSFTIPMGQAGEPRKFQFGTPNRVNVDLKLQMPVFTWGRISSLIDISKVGRSMAEVQRRQQKVNITDQVLRAYYAVLLNEEIIRLRQASVKRAESHLQVAQDRFNAGVVPRLELNFAIRKFR